jgi:putative glutamine amidotransferase
MAANSPPVRIGVFGPDNTDQQPRRGFALWPTGYSSALKAAGAEPVALGTTTAGRPLDAVLDGLHGLVIAGSDQSTMREVAEEEDLCRWCKTRQLPLLAIDHGLHTLNSTFGGSVYLDVGREVPEALQHRHPPESGLRHAINVIGGTRLAHIYGEGEIVVNSEHRRAVSRVARGFRVSGRALDGVIEAIEAEAEGWFALGVQWHPASATASGLDIQLFRGLVDNCARRLHKPGRSPRRALLKAG